MMKIEARFVAKTPEMIEGLDWLKITLGTFVLKVYRADDELRLVLDDRFGDALAVFPYATNTIALYAKRKKAWVKKRVVSVPPAKSMKVEARCGTKVKKTIVDVERLAITHGTFVSEIVVTNGGLRLRLDEPLGDQLVVFPYALNIIALYATREDGK